METKESKLSEFLRERLEPTPVAAHDLLLTCEVGSTAHGMAVEGQDDLDAMSIYLETPEFITGLSKAKSYMFRTQPEGVKSGPGDIDVTLHPLSKWMKLAAWGNPTILMMLWAPVLGVGDNTFSIALRSRGPGFLISKRAGQAFLGYMTAQRVRLVEGKSMRVNRPELIEQYGYDVKYAAHALRLGLQGIELMRHGSVRVPMDWPMLELVQDMRGGEFSKTDALAMIEHYEFALIDAIEKSTAPDFPNMGQVNFFLHQVYMTRWEQEAMSYD